MAKTRREKVQGAIKEIREFYRLGREIPPKRSHKETFRQGIIVGEAERRNINPETVRQARQFAQDYTAQEVNELCALIKRVQTDQDRTAPVFGRTHIVRLLTIKPKSRRIGFQKKVIEGGWSLTTLQAEIAKRYGARRVGGRRRRIPSKLEDLLTQIERMCEEWRRWYAELARTGEEIEHLILTDLPAPARKQVIEISKRLWTLQAIVTKELKRWQPGREERAALRPIIAGAARASHRKRTGEKNPRA